jgi:hypothetical protein
VPRVYSRTDATDRFFTFVLQDLAADGCWRWLGNLSHNGYGRFWFDGRNMPAHRYIWELKNGPVPVGLEIDHLCRSRSCVNPDHLEAVTHQENQRRGCGSVTHCRHGHPLSGDNLYICPRGRRECKTCRRRAGDRYKSRTNNTGVESIGSR